MRKTLRTIRRLFERKVKIPQQMLGELFHDVQRSRLFLDSKTFADSILRGDRAKTLDAYAQLEREPTGESEGLSRFVQSHFELPLQGHTATPRAAHEDIRSYIAHTWYDLTRGPDQDMFTSSLLALPYQYVVPGGRFREVYYWDSYFTMLGLREDGEGELLESMVKNFAFLIEKYGFVPNANRSYYISRSQPPVFAMMVELLADLEGDQVYREYLPHLLDEYNFWMRGKSSPPFVLHNRDFSQHVVRMQGGEILNRYCDALNLPRDESFFEDLELQERAPQPSKFFKNIRSAAESGWDFSSRWQLPGAGIETTRVLDIVPVDLNALMVRMEEIIARASEVCEFPRQAKLFRDRRDQRIKTMQKYFWSEEKAWFCDYLLPERSHSPELTTAGAFALYAGVATSEQAAVCAETIRNTFLQPGGVATSLVHSGEQWDAPNGWAPLQYMTVMGLERYGHYELARDVAERWCHTVMMHFEKEGTILEKYNIEEENIATGGGEYEVQQGFGWTNGVTLFFLNKYKVH